jgi:ATP-dependent Lon protease
LAAVQAHIDTIIIPRRNEKDLEDIPRHLRKKVEFVLARTMDEVLAAALKGTA